MSSPADAARRGPEPSLFIHIGMPKTGTTAVQRLLHTSGPTLARRGYVYPDRWIVGEAGGHHALTHSISRDPAEAAAISREVCEYLGEQRGRSVILSAEGLASTLLAEHTRGMIVGFVERCASVAETTVVMALRRLDEFIASAYLQVTKKGRGNGALTPEQFVQGRGREWTSGLFAGISAFREESAARLVLLPYLEGGDSISMVLDAVGLGDAHELVGGLPDQVNRRLGLKAQAVFLLPDQALEVLGVRQRRHLVELFDSGEFAFSDEIYDYDLLGAELRRRVQARALEEARRFGITEYTDAFSKIESPPTPRTPLATSLLSRTDLHELSEAIQARRRKRAAHASSLPG